MHVKCNIYHILGKQMSLAQPALYPRSDPGSDELMSTRSQRWCHIYRCLKFNLAWWRVWFGIQVVVPSRKRATQQKPTSLPCIHYPSLH